MPMINPESHGQILTLLTMMAYPHGMKDLTLIELMRFLDS